MDWTAEPGRVYVPDWVRRTFFRVVFARNWSCKFQGLRIFPRETDVDFWTLKHAYLGSYHLLTNVRFFGLVDDGKLGSGK